jgi:2-dehydropantoate 2-reductase
LALPELKDVVGLEKGFSAETLEVTVNTCSMVWDLRARRETEINFINGSWSRMGRKVGVKIPVNDQLVKQILEKCSSY